MNWAPAFACFSLRYKNKQHDAFSSGSEGTAAASFSVLLPFRGCHIIILR